MFATKQNDEEKYLLDQFQFRKNTFEVVVELQRETLCISATHLKNGIFLKGQFAFNSLPDTLKVYEDVKNIYKYIKAQKDTNNIIVNDQGLEIQYSMAGLITKRAVLSLQQMELSEKERMEKYNNYLSKEWQKSQKQVEDFTQEKQIFLKHYQITQKKNQEEIEKRKKKEFLLIKENQNLKKQFQKVQMKNGFLKESKKKIERLYKKSCSAELQKKEKINDKEVAKPKVEVIMCNLIIGLTFSILLAVIIYDLLEFMFKKK